MWPCPYCRELHPVASRVDHLTIRHNRFPCLNCDLVSASAEGLTKHDQEMHRYTLNGNGGPSDDGGSVGPVMEVSGFIMEVLLTLRDIKEQQNVQFGTLSEQIGAMRSELEEVKRSVDQRSDALVVKIIDGQGEMEKVPLELSGDMIYTEQWNPKDYFPINSVEQLKQLDEISRLAEEHAHFTDLNITLESQNPDGWNPNGLVEFCKTFDRTFALKLFVTPEETPQQCISLCDYKAFLGVLSESWKAAGPKRINRRLRHYLKLNRENINTTSDNAPQVNSTSDEVDRNVNGKRVNSAPAPDQSQDFVVVKRRRGTIMKLTKFKQEHQQLQDRGLSGNGSCK
uniref:C2H2-type domain-containing protein n=1 Tax=Culex pipiens pipiens TaxID=38569 RepID=A0ABD1DB58_CULPP